MDAFENVSVPPKPRRGTRARLLESDIENCPEGKACKLTDGGGLYVSVDIQGNKYFQFRYFLNRKEGATQLGKYPEMSLESARGLAKLRKIEVDKAKEKQKDDLFHKKIKKILSEDRSDDFFCFHSMEDAREFVSNLIATRGDCTKSFDVASLILLSLLIPALPSELISASFMDFDEDRCIWKIQYLVYPHTAKKRKRRVAFLSKEAMKMRMPGRIIDNLFPRLKALDRASVDKELTVFLNSIWKHYKLKIEDFALFFKAMATEYSLFNPKLIDDAMKHSDANGDIENLSYRIQRIAISEWWSQELIGNNETIAHYP